MMHQTKHFIDSGMGEGVFLYPEKFAALSETSALSGMIATFVVFYLFTFLYIFSLLRKNNLSFASHWGQAN